MLPGRVDKEGIQYREPPSHPISPRDWWRAAGANRATACSLVLTHGIIALGGIGAGCTGPTGPAIKPFRAVLIQGIEERP